METSNGPSRSDFLNRLGLNLDKRCILLNVPSTLGEIGITSAILRKWIDGRSTRARHTAGLLPGGLN